MSAQLNVQADWPMVALIGRPNVGKSTLFNALTRTRDALVADMPGVTRDRQYGIVTTLGQPFYVCDTGGMMSDADGLDALTAGQARVAMEEADVVLFMVDAKGGLTPEDQEIVRAVRQLDKPWILTVNKVDGQDLDAAQAEFFALGAEHVHAISAEHRRGLSGLYERLESLVDWPVTDDDRADADEALGGPCRLTIVGRPNVGKSTLFNRLLGEERVLASDVPGTTRDVVRVPLDWRGVDYELIDTAGVRRKARVNDVVEKFSALKTLKAIQGAHIAVLLIDATEGITDQDLTLLAMVLDSGRGAVIGVNKWDDVDAAARKQIRATLDRRLDFAPFLDVIPVSAMHGSGLGDLMHAVRRAYASATTELKTPQLTSILERAVAAHQPPMKQGRVARLRYAHGGGLNPPRIVIHGNRVDTVPESYRRYLSNCFRKALKIHGTPLLIEFRGGGNPYANRKNTLTQRQLAKRKRLKRFVKRKR